MLPKSKSDRRAATLGPNRSVVVVSAAEVNQIDPGAICATTIGQKAVGLLMIPRDWTSPFFVVLDEALSRGLADAAIESSLRDGASRSGVVPSRVIVRSNGVQEGLSQRGALDSKTCDWASLLSTLRTLRDDVASKTSSTTHWVIQNELVVKAKGHLSNERRVKYDRRDWVAEIGGIDGSSADQISLAVRHWRQGENPHQGRLSCDSALKISLSLKHVAHWAVQDSRRFLFEWVWDGAAVYVVQMDVASHQRGENPRKLLPPSIPQVSTDNALRCFVRATDEHKRTLRKLSNAALYEELGYTMPPFFVLNDPSIMGDLINGRPLPSSLTDDLNLLTAHRPLILRTEGIGLPPEKKEMLPRTEELRSGQAAARWLLDSFGPEIRKLDIADRNIALIGHHFIPSVSSAWAGAAPGKRWVRIEALWGIPESLYWHAHDTLEVDTEKANLAGSPPEDCEYDVRLRARFKGTFIAPDQDGAWVHHETKPPHDWAPTITSQELICEIAHTTRRICEREGKPVLVMWFVETHVDATRHRVLPWYHSVIETPDTPVRAPRKKIRSSQEVNIRTEHDWLLLKEAVGGVRIERITVEPNDPALVRSQTFAQELGTFAHLHGIVVVLSGGILAHPYHALRRADARVECVDLFGADEERVEYNKVVRDKIPDQISNRGESFEVVHLTGQALVLALRRKLVEEALEALDAVSGTDLIAELADVQEVISAIAKAIGVSEQQLDQERLLKLKKRGAFDDGQMLLTTASPYSINPAASSDQLITGDVGPQVRTISDPHQLPRKAVYKRPDHRNIGDGTEELLVIETELNRLGKLHESINFEIPPQLDARKYTSCIELSRTGGELRAAIRVQARLGKGEGDGQLSFEFAPNPGPGQKSDG